MTIAPAIAMTLFIIALAAIFIAYLIGRYFGREAGRNEGFALGHQRGWVERHEDSTDEERKSWRERHPGFDYYERPQS